MNKRLRKKKHVGEYDYLGFWVKCRVSQDWGAAQVEKTCDNVIQFCEAHNLNCGGAFGTLGFEVYITTGHDVRRPGGYLRYVQEHCTETHRNLFVAWGKSQGLDLDVGPLVGSWHGAF